MKSSRFRGTGQPAIEPDEIILQTETIDQMKPNIKQLFIFIKTHIMNDEHPINRIAGVFVQNYVDFYSREILNNAE